MGYRKAEEVLPIEIIQLIQNYVSGESIYIPQKENQRLSWGSGTNTRQKLHKRNHSIYKDYEEGLNTTELSAKYYLSIKSIQRIIRDMKANN